MKISEQQYCELMEGVVREGTPQLSVGPLPGSHADVPAEWGEILTSHDPRDGIAGLWRPVADRVPRIYRALQERLQGVGFLRTDEVPASLIYFFTDGDEWIPFRGRSPLSEHTRAASRLSEEFLEFYRIHDGWVHHYSEDSGPLPFDRWSSLANLWIDVSWNIPPGDISAETAIVVYRDGEDLALAYDTSHTDPLPLRCYNDGTVDVLLDMWAAIDREVGSWLEALGVAPRRRPAAGRSVADGGHPSADRFDGLVTRLPERRVLAAHLPGGGAYDQLSDLLLHRAAQEKVAGQRDKVVQHYQEALRHWTASIDSGGDVSPEEILDWFGLAHALNDVATAHFVATLPPSIWADDSLDALQARALFCLYLGDVEGATAFVDELLGSTFNEGEEPDLEADITARMIQALARKDVSAFAEARQRAVDELTKGRAEQRALLPWRLRLRGFDAVASRMGVRPLHK